ncbi:DUF805 domain-containing protein [Acinetobacter nematophilus]|uniref:DUF805 domain-containing protein n=1 Tax=Acinetobacter nematophilus TaxID=2994642 RepID=UPI003AF8763E
MNPFETQTSTSQPHPTSFTPNKDNPFSPKGRFGRLSYLAWLFIISMLYTCVLFIIAGLAVVALMQTGSQNPAALLESSLGYFVIFLAVAVVIAFTVVNICIAIRRIHDLNKSGWLWLLFLIPLVNIFFGIYVMCAKGTEGNNNYGPQRQTEQTEKLLGSLYAVFLAIFIVAYGSIAVWMISMQGSMPQSMDSMEMAEHDSAKLEQELAQAAQELEQTSDEIEPSAQDAEQSTETENKNEDSHSNTQEVNQR